MMYRRNADNLGRLAELLRTLPSGTPFAMDCFASNAWDELSPLEYVPGTPGVTAGPIALAVDAGIAPTGREWTWEAFAERALIAPGGDDWSWCFAPEWAEVNNTPAAAADRIELLLREGTPPSWWSKSAPAMLALSAASEKPREIDPEAELEVSLAALVAQSGATDVRHS